MNTLHTKGPWTFVSQCESNNVQHECFLGTINSDRWNIAAVWGDAGDTIGEAEANARLISAAPELLEVLSKVNHTLTAHGKVQQDTPLHELILSVIAKATGKKEEGI
jgi:hypothetical protein